MNKLIKSMICILGTCSLFLVGCSNGASEKEKEANKEVNSQTKIEKSNDKSNKDEGVDTSKETESGVDSSNESANTYLTKQIYLEKLNKLEADLNISLEEKYSGTTQQMIEAGYEEYKEWDNVLNEVYSELKKQLTEKEMDKLTEEELNWIKSRDEKSEAAANENKGGTIEPLNRVMSLVTSTKERCYELVNQYMK